MKEIITLDYGSGGKKTSSLIENMILPVLGNEALSVLGDGAIVPGNDKLVFSTDSFVVNPLKFPGGDIGKLSVCGTVNDIAMAGGLPKFLSLSFIIEEGLEVDLLKEIIESINLAASKAGVSIVTGDTKVVEKGKGDGIYINTAGIGFLSHKNLSPKNISEGDAVIISGYVGDHGTAIMLARDPSFGESDIKSDCAPLNEMASSLYDLGDDLKVLRDPTRGGVATTLNEFVEGTDYCIELNEKDIPIRPSVMSSCDMLGLDPMYCANEGKMLVVSSPDKAEEVIRRLKNSEYGRDAAIIGTVTKNHPGRVTMKTELGGSRILTKLAGAQLPRIC